MKREVTLPGGPHIDPAVGNPKVRAYAEGLQNRKYTTPVAGGPGPSIPRLDQSHHEGMTMADQAARAMFPGGQQQPAQGSPSGFIQPMGAPMHRTNSNAILPTDLLPEQATKDPEFQPGMGARYAVNNPQLAMKYGVLRNNNFVPPQQLQTGRPGLKPGTIEDLKQLQDLQRASQAAAPPTPTPEKDVSSGAAGAAARLANAAGDDDTRPLTDEDRQKIKKSLDSMDDFDFNTFREAMMKDILNNDDQRKLVESRCTPMDVTDLILKNRVNQIVPIIPGKFEPEFQSLSAEEDLALKRLIMVEGKSINVSERYLLDKYSLMGVAAGLFALNKTPLPSQSDKTGQFDDALFMAKFNFVIKFPFHMLSSLGINFYWFDVRVRKLFQVESIKNG